jgi:hypothetical protein
VFLTGASALYLAAKHVAGGNTKKKHSLHSNKILVFEILKV